MWHGQVLDFLILVSPAIRGVFIIEGLLLFNIHDVEVLFREKLERIMIRGNLKLKQNHDELTLSVDSVSSVIRKVELALA